MNIKGANHIGNILPDQFQTQKVNQSSSQETETSVNIQDSFVKSDSDGFSGADKVQGGFSIIFTNDIHGKVKPWHDQGGAENLSGVINQLKAENPNHILIDAGDMAYNPPFSEEHRFTPMDQIMNKLGYDSIGLGNHEFQTEANEFGGVYGNPNPNMVDNIFELATVANLPLVNCNAVLTDTHQTPDFLKPFIIKDLNGVKVGVTSVCTNRLATSSHPLVGKNWEIKDPVASLNKTIPRMKQAGAQVIVVMSHENLNNNKGIISRTSGIDILIGAHDHKLTNTPISVRDKSGREVPLIEAAGHTRYVGDLQVSVSDKKVSLVSSTMHECKGAEAKADPEISAIVKKWEKEYPAEDKYEERPPSHFYKD